MPKKNLEMTVNAFVFAAPFTGTSPFMFVAVEKFGKRRFAGLGWTEKEASFDLFDILFDLDLISTEHVD